MSSSTPHYDIDMILRAYACGLFPMADSASAADINWYDPPQRGQLPIAGLHIPTRLRRTVRQQPYRIAINTAFTEVISACAAPAPGRPESWINPVIRDLFIALHDAGFAHSVEAYDHSGHLVGGLYGLALGGAFMGESMFSRARDASKIALIHLCARLWHNGFTVLDTQFTNPHLEQFGVYEINRDAYHAQLAQALPVRADFTRSEKSEFEMVQAFLAMQKAQKQR